MVTLYVVVILAHFKVRREFDNSEHKLTERLLALLAFVSFVFPLMSCIARVALVTQFSVHGAFF